MKDFFYPLRVIHGNIHEWRVNILPLYIERLKNARAVYLVLTPEHGNLGDHAITQSEVEILHELKIPYIELTDKRIHDLETKNAVRVMNGRTILINGGGNLGTLWPDVEKMTREIIEKNPKSRIIILPNTIYYEDDENGHLELEKSIELYNKHRNLKIYAREESSFNLMKAIYRNVALAPDMVLRMNKCKKTVKRKGCILCLRSDREKTRTEEIEEVIHTQATELFGNNVSSLDMVVSHSIPVSERDEQLEKQYDAFRHSELVITDRLHGMVFCAITGTPCIVINSRSPKILGCYEWIKNLPYIQFCEDVSKIVSIFKSIPKQDWQYNNTYLLPLYETLKEDIILAAKK